jgi:hypothetical protein
MGAVNAVMVGNRIPISNPVSLGVTAPNTTNPTLSTSVVAPNGSVVLVWVGANANSTGVTIGGVAANLVKRSTGDIGGYVLELWASAVLSGSLAAASSIAVANTGNGGGRITVGAEYVSGISSATADATGNTPFGSAAPASAATGALAQANEIVVSGCFLSTNGGGTPVMGEGAGFTRLTGSSNNGAGTSTDASLTTGYQIVAATTTVTSAPTSTINGFGETVVASFKGW